MAVLAGAYLPRTRTDIGTMVVQSQEAERSAVLAELDIQDLAVAEHVRIAFASGLTAITGETGAGKSIIVDALELLLGGRADATLVRSGAPSARVEGIFHLASGPISEELAAALEAAGIESVEDELIISREIPAGGRVRTARVNGRAVVQSVLAALGSRLVDIHGQTDHVALLQPAEHIGYLDRFAGTDALRREFGTGAQQLRRLRTEIGRLQTNERERLRRQERLAFEVAEIDGAEVRPGEEDELRAERTLLESAEQLVDLAEGAYAILMAGGRGGSAIDALGRVSDTFAQLVLLDPRLNEDAATAAALQEQATDLARSVRAYREGVERNPARLRAIEDRISLLVGLKRKYGASIEEVLAYADAARTQLEELAGSEERREQLEADEAALVARLADLGGRLAREREQAASRLVAAIEEQLLALSMGGARFAVSFLRRSVAEGGDGLPVRLSLAAMIGGEAAQEVCADTVSFDHSGLDRVEFFVSFNPGEVLRPLARVASGGETSRLMLALKTVLGDADAVPTLVFDEIEAGLGGRTGGVVGEKLAALGEHHQVICITHLPQIAARAGQHLTVIKTVEQGRTRTLVQVLDGDDRVHELAAMMGSVTAATIAGAKDLLGGPASDRENRKLRAI